MRQQKQNIIVVESDPQILKGLVLMLEDMQFRVTPLHHLNELEKIQTELHDDPVLIILPFEAIDDRTGYEWIMQLREDFQQPIPAILLCHENGLNPDSDIGKDIIVLSDHITPHNLRLSIKTLLVQALLEKTNY